MASTPLPSSSYWCYRCSRHVQVWNRDSVVCPDCDGGFIEELGSPVPARRRSHGAAAVYVLPGRRSTADLPPHPPPRRGRRFGGGGDRSPFNPVIVLRGPPPGVAGLDDDEGGDGGRGGLELYYDDGAGPGLRPLPAGMSDFLMGTGLDVLLDQLAQFEINGVGRFEHPPASKAAVDSMPTVKIEDTHIVADSHCPVCQDAFELGSEAREMPCKHLYHSDCILPWLSMRNSCPVCRHELPTDDAVERRREADGDSVGLTIWRLPGGGFAVGRFSDGRRAVERELPVVYTEMDGGFNGNGAPRRISWTSRSGRSRDNGGRIGRAFRSFFTFFGLLRPSHICKERYPRLILVGFVWKD